MKRLLAFMLVLSTIVLIGPGGPTQLAFASGLGNCPDSGYPAYWVDGPGDPIVWGQNFDVSSLPSNWYPFNSFYSSGKSTYQPGDTTDRLPSQLSYPSHSYIQLNNKIGEAGPDYYIDDAGIGTNSSLYSGPEYGEVFYAWCARFNSSTAFDTDAEVQQGGSGATWPPEVDFVESGNIHYGADVSVNVHWRATNYQDGASCGSSENCNATMATWTSPANSWNEFAVSWDSTAIEVYEWNGSTWVSESTVTDSACGIAADGPGYSEPCVPQGYNYQWTYQQNSNNGTSTVNNTNFPTGLKWVANYYYLPCCRLP